MSEEKTIQQKINEDIEIQNRRYKLLQENHNEEVNLMRAELKKYAQEIKTLQMKNNLLTQQVETLKRITEKGS